MDWLCRIFPRGSNPVYQHKKRDRHFGQELFLGMKTHLAGVLHVVSQGNEVRQRGTREQGSATL